MKSFTKIIASIILMVMLFIAGSLQAQYLKISPGSSLKITAGTAFKSDSLTLIPSADFTLSDVILSKSSTVIHATPNTYISRVYHFSNTTNPFSGDVQINYEDGAELNGIPENALTLNVHNGINWSMYPASNRDGINNFVLTTGLPGIVLNELTLASLSAPLPLTWQSFTATRQSEQVLLKWATSQEQNTRDFTVQHSTNGISWASIGTQPAAGNSSNTSHYSYVHINPVAGINYYRILQTDLDNNYSYSVVRTVAFTKTVESFIVLGNPVTDGMLKIQVNDAVSMAIYTANGKLLWMEKLNPGVKTIDVSRFAKGIYFLRANTFTQKILIQ